MDQSREALLAFFFFTEEKHNTDSLKCNFFYIEMFSTVGVFLIEYANSD